MNREFSTKGKVESVTIDGREYEIREMTGEGRDIYLQAIKDTVDVQMEGTGKKDADGREVMKRRVRIRSLDGAQKTLLSQCLYDMGDGPDRAARPSKQQIASWPATLIDDLAKIATKLNGLEDPDSIRKEEAEKN